MCLITANLSAAKLWQVWDFGMKWQHSHEILFSVNFFFITAVIAAVMTGKSV